MKKSAGVILLFGLLALTLFGCGQKAPFPAENAESVEVYRYVVPASAEKKIVTEPEEVEDICEQLIAAGTPKEGEPLAGGRMGPPTNGFALKMLLKIWKSTKLSGIV